MISYVTIEFGEPRNGYSITLSLQALCDLGACSFATGSKRDVPYTVAWIDGLLHVLEPTGKRRQTRAVEWRSKEGQRLRRVIAGGLTELRWERP